MKKGGVGCLPCAVFLLVLAVAAGIYFERHWHDLPRESAGRTVIEVLGAPSAAEMEAHRQRILSGEILQAVLRESDERDSGGPDRIQQLRERTEVTAQGPFLTITVRGGKRGLEKQAAAIATAYEKDLIEQTAITRRLRSQALEAHATITESDAEKARLEMLDFAKKTGLSAEGAPSSHEAEEKLLANRAAKIKVDLALLEERRKLLAGDDLKTAAGAALVLPWRNQVSQLLSNWQGAEAAAAADAASAPAKEFAEKEKAALLAVVKSMRGDLSQQTAALSMELGVLTKQQDKLRAETFIAQMRRQEFLAVKENYERSAGLLRRLRAEAAENRVDHSVALRPVRTVDAAHELRVPARRTLRGLKTAAAACGVLLVACLLTALTKCLCRRA